MLPTASFADVVGGPGDQVDSYKLLGVLGEGGFAVLLEAIEDRTEKLGPQHPHTLASIKNLIDLYEIWGKRKEAEEWREKLGSSVVTEQKTRR